jgi:RNA polymerase sigma-70 factor, ECF subfamily
VDTDDQVLARSARDRSQFTQLVPTHSLALRAYLIRRAGAAADDLLAEVWLQAYSGRHSYDPSRGTARAWLIGIARHVLLGHYRHRGRAAARTMWAAERHDPWDEVDRRLDAAALAPAMRQALAALPAVERELLLLVAWEQLTPSEAATVLGISPAAARTRLHRARTRLKQQLPDPEPSPALSINPLGASA